MASTPTQEDRKLLVAIDTAEAVSYGADQNNVLNEQRADNIQRYLGDPNRLPAPADRSSVVDRSSFEMIEWIMPSLLRIFTSGDEVAKFEPQGPEDEKMAQQESDYINYVILQRNNWHQICNDWFKDALMVKGGYALAYWEKKTQVETEEYEAQTDDSLAMLMQDDGIEIVKHTSYVDEQGASDQAKQFQQQMQQYQMAMQQMQSQPPQMGPGGQSMPPQLPPPPQQQPPPMLHDVVIRRTKEKGKVCIHVLPPERCKISERTPDYTLKDCPYFEVWDFQTISDLRKLGFDVDDDISDDMGNTQTAIVENVRDQFNENSWMEDDSAANEPSMRRVKFRMIWIEHDYDDDGIAELNYVCRVGRTVLHRSEANRIPVASICPVPLPHRHVGLSIADVVADLEDIKTAILRQGIDNIFLTNNARYAATDKVNLDDLLTNVPGGYVRIDGGMPAEQIMPLQVPFIFPQAVQGLEYIDNVRQARSGVNNYFTGLDQNALNRTASGVAQLTSSAAQRVEMIARLFANGVEYLFSVVHELILKHGHKQEVVRLRNQWTPVDPSEWKQRDDARIAVGLGTGAPDAQMSQLMTIYQLQMQSSPLGLVQPQNVYRTCAEIVKAARLSGPELYFTDPGNAPMPNHGGPPPQVQVKQMDIQADQQKFSAQAQLDMREKMADQQLERERMDREDALKKYQIDVQANTQLQIATMQFNVDRAQLAADSYFNQAKADAEHLGMKMDMVQSAMTNSQRPTTVVTENKDHSATMSRLTEAMSQLATTMAAPRKRTAIRDAQGRLTGATDEVMPTKLQ